MLLTCVIYSTVNNKSNADNDLTQSQSAIRDISELRATGHYHVSVPPAWTRGLDGQTHAQYRSKGLESTLVIDPRHC
jgi:hypothetical protein